MRPRATTELRNDLNLAAANESLQIALESARLLVFEWTPGDDALRFTDTRGGGDFLANQVRTSKALNDLIHDYDRGRLRDRVVRNLRSRSTGDLDTIEVRIKDLTGQWRWVEVRGRVAERDARGRATRFVGSFRDISARKEAQIEYERARSLYAALVATNQAIGRCRTRPALFAEVCRIAVHHAGFRMAWIGEVDPHTQRVVPVASAGNAGAYLNKLVISTDPSVPQGQGPGGQALREKRPIVWNDFLRNDHSIPWREDALRAGFRSVASIPIIRQATTFGILGLYSTSVDHFDAPLVKLLEEMASDLSLALDRFDEEERRLAVEKQLQTSEALKTAVMNTAFDPIICLDATGTVIAYNPAAERTLGYPADQVLGQDFIDFLVPARYRELRRRSWNHFLKTGESDFVNRRVESIAHCADGREIPIELATMTCKVNDEIVMTLHFRDISEAKRFEAMLREDAARYRQLVERMPEAVLVYRDGDVLLANQAAAHLLGGASSETLVGHSIYDFILPEFHHSATAGAGAAHAEAGPSAPFAEQVWQRLDGSRIEVECARTSVDFEGGAAHQMIVRDVTERRRSEDFQRRQNQILSLIAGNADLDEVMVEVVDFIETQSTRARGTVMLLDETGQHLHHCVSPSMPASFRQAVDPLPVGPNSGVCGTAAYLGEPVIVRDVETHPLTQAMVELARVYQIGALASWPIMGKRGQILGTFALYYTTPAEPNPLEMALVALATDLAGIAIESWLAEERIRYLAHYDELTNLPNRFLLNQLLEDALRDAQSDGRKLATLFLDLDRFKNINDTFGHGVGDDVLREVGSRFRSCLRASDKIARMGGDEFFILIDDIENSSQVTDVALRILEQASRPFFIKGEECQLSASIGIAMFPDDGVDGDALLKFSDIAMYRAKSQGKNTFQFYSASKNIHTVQRMSLESRLRRAVDQDEFVLHYQPRVDLKTLRITGVEALVRWQHPERGLLPPAEFIPIAEESGLIVPLGRSILSMATRDARHFELELGRTLRTAVNLSVRQLDAANFARDIGELLRASSLEASAIELEITESMLIQNPENAERVVSDLRAMGIGVSIDDFGTGYSSLTYLKRFPIEAVKVDRSFVKDLPGDANDLAITQAIVAMAHSLGLKVIAEGVETHEQQETLRRMGCDEFQGFLFSRALPVTELLALVRATEPEPATEPERATAA